MSRVARDNNKNKRASSANNAAISPYFAASQDAESPPARKKVKRDPAAESRDVVSKQEGSTSTKATMPLEVLTSLPPSPSVTAFQSRVYSALLSIPAGRVATYGSLSAHLGSSARAVGQALGKNPWAPRVPCHRVVAADGYLGGFVGTWGIEGDSQPEKKKKGDGAQTSRKKELLAAEGVHFDGKGYLKDRTQFYAWPEAELKKE